MSMIYSESYTHALIWYRFDTNASPNVGGTHRSPDPPFPSVPIPDSDLDQIYSGRQLHMLTQENIHITDEGLLRLLGIDLATRRLSNARKSALVHLSINSNGRTHRSGARILQECSRLEVVDFENCRIASLELFQGDA